jgi:hypothetical protein
MSNRLGCLYYSDPNHPGCDREVIQESSTAGKVYGKDAAGGEGASCDGTTDVAWGPLEAVIDGDMITVDFSPKGGPSDLEGKYANSAINWEDGNAWPKISSSE